MGRGVSCNRIYLLAGTGSRRGMCQLVHPSALTSWPVAWSWQGSERSAVRGPHLAAKPSTSSKRRAQLTK